MLLRDRRLARRHSGAASATTPVIFDSGGTERVRVFSFSIEHKFARNVALALPRTRVMSKETKWPAVNILSGYLRWPRRDQTLLGRKGQVGRKIVALVGDAEQPFEYGDVFSREVVRGVERLRIALDENHDRCVVALISRLLGPFQLLYVLHTTRTGAGLGRYESPELSAEEVKVFLGSFGRFLTEDARHDFWIRSHGDDATIVLDRHNLIYAYGPLDALESVLRAIGATPDAPPPIPDPHVHHYHPEWDDAERGVLRALDWRVSPLRDSDVQFAAIPN